MLTIGETDEELLAAICAGDADAFLHLHERHAAHAQRIALRVLGDLELAEEVVQEVFLNVWRRPRGYEPLRGAAAPWLFSVVRHRAIDCWRSERRRPTAAQDSEQQFASLIAADDTENEILDRERCRELSLQVQQLPLHQCVVVELGYYGELTHSEIATRLQIPLGTAKSRMRLGLQRLSTEIAA